MLLDLFRLILQCRVVVVALSHAEAMIVGQLNESDPQSQQPAQLMMILNSKSRQLMMILNSKYLAQNIRFSPVCFGQK